MLDTIINTSFHLDYEIFHTINIGNCVTYISNLHKLKTSLKDIDDEFYEFLDNSKIIFTDLIQLLNICDEQRRVI